MWTGNPQLLHTKLESGPFEPQTRCGAIRTREDPIRLFQDRQDMFSFDLFEGRPSIRLATICDVRLEIGRRNMEHRTPRENHCSFNHVLHFTDISRPGIADQCAHGFRRDCVYLLLHFACKMLGEVPNQKRNIFCTFS